MCNPFLWQQALRCPLQLIARLAVLRHRIVLLGGFLFWFCCWVAVNSIRKDTKRVRPLPSGAYPVVNSRVKVHAGTPVLIETMANVQPV
jgi:hypothetical protein